MKYLVAFLLCFNVALAGVVKVATMADKYTECQKAAQASGFAFNILTYNAQTNKLNVKLFLFPPVFNSYSENADGSYALQPAWDGVTDGASYELAPGATLAVKTYYYPQISPDGVTHTITLPSIPAGVAPADWNPPIAVYSTGYTPQSTAATAVATAKADMETKAAAAAAAPIGSSMQTSAQAAYEMARDAYERLLEQQQGLTAKSTAATTKATASTTATQALVTTSSTQASGSTGEAVAVAGKATVAAIDALRAEQSLNSQKLVDAVKASSGSGGGGTNNAGVESRLDTANSHLAKLGNLIDGSQQGIAAAQAEVAVIKDAYVNAVTTANAAAAGVTATHGAPFAGGSSAANGWGAPSPAQAPQAYTPIDNVALHFPSGTVSVAIDPVSVLTTWGIMPFLAVARSLIVFACVVGVYRFVLSSCAPLVSNLFTSESAHTSASQTGTAGVYLGFTATVSSSFSLVKPILSASRLALLLALPVALVGVLDAYLSSLGASSTGILGGLNAAYALMLSAGGRGVYILNLLIPLPTVIFSGVYASTALSVIYGVYVVAKGKATALQSV